MSTHAPTAFLQAKPLEMEEHAREEDNLKKLLQLFQAANSRISEAGTASFSSFWTALDEWGGQFMIGLQLGCSAAVEGLLAASFEERIMEFLSNGVRVHGYYPMLTSSSCMCVIESLKRRPLMAEPFSQTAYRLSSREDEQQCMITVAYTDLPLGITSEQAVEAQNSCCNTVYQMHRTS